MFDLAGLSAASCANKLRAARHGLSTRSKATTAICTPRAIICLSTTVVQADSSMHRAERSTLHSQYRSEYMVFALSMLHAPIDTRPLNRRAWHAVPPLLRNRARYPRSPRTAARLFWLTLIKGRISLVSGPPFPSSIRRRQMCLEIACYFLGNWVMAFKGEAHDSGVRPRGSTAIVSWKQR